MKCGYSRFCLTWEILGHGRVFTEEGMEIEMRDVSGNPRKDTRRCLWWKHGHKLFIHGQQWCCRCRESTNVSKRRAKHQLVSVFIAGKTLGLEHQAFQNQVFFPVGTHMQLWPVVPLLELMSWTAWLWLSTVSLPLWSCLPHFSFTFLIPTFLNSLFRRHLR